MTAYNMLDGTPCTANPWLLIDKLRNEWGFDGFTIADADAVGIIHKLHHTVNNFSEAGADAINGVWMSSSRQHTMNTDHSYRLA